MGIECKGNCFDCEALKNEEVDAVVCPIRIVMKRTEIMREKLDYIINNIDSNKEYKKIIDIDVIEEVKEEITEKIS